jgi:hypothetical protein
MAEEEGKGKLMTCRRGKAELVASSWSERDDRSSGGGNCWSKSLVSERLRTRSGDTKKREVGVSSQSKGSSDHTKRKEAYQLPSQPSA